MYVKKIGNKHKKNFKRCKMKDNITMLYPLVLETELARKTKEIIEKIKKQNEQRYRPANDNKR